MIKEIKERLNKLVSAVTFDYKGEACGIDPLAQDNYEMWYGEKTYVAKSVEDAMSVKLFDGKSFEEIIDIVENLDY